VVRVFLFFSLYIYPHDPHRVFGSFCFVVACFENPPCCNKSLSCFENVSRGECFVFGLSFSLHMSVTLYVVLYKSRSLFRPLRHTAQIKNFLCGRFFQCWFSQWFCESFVGCLSLVFLGMRQKWRIYLHPSFTLFEALLHSVCIYIFVSPSFRPH